MNYEALREKIRERVTQLQQQSLETSDPNWSVALLLAQIELGNVINETWKMERDQQYTPHPTLATHYGVDPGDED